MEHFATYNRQVFDWEILFCKVSFLDITDFDGHAAPFLDFLKPFPIDPSVLVVTDSRPFANKT